MDFKRIICIFIVCSISLFMAACGAGGGSGNTNASLTLVLSSNTVAAGTAVNALVTVSSTSLNSKSNLTPKLVSDDLNIVPSVDSPGTNESGSTNVNLFSRNIKSTPSSVKVWAILDGVKSNVVTLTVTPPILTLTPPADATFTQTAVESPAGSGNFVCSGGVVRVVVSGAQATFKNSSGQNIQGQPIIMSLKSITNGLTGIDQVVFYPGGATETIVPPYTTTVTLTTDTNGVAILPVAIDGLLPSTLGLHVFTVNWQADTQIIGDDGNPILFTVNQDTQIVNTCQ